MGLIGYCLVNAVIAEVESGGKVNRGTCPVSRLLRSYALCVGSSDGTYVAKIVLTPLPSRELQQSLLKETMPPAIQDTFGAPQ
jgi:hypothetical protein